jgi:hypothetical protein
MTVLSMLDSAGRRRSPATMPGYHVGRPPRNKGMRYPADPPTVEEIVAVMRHATDDRHGWAHARDDRGLVAGLRVQEALALAEHVSTTGADRCSCATAREAGDARSAWTSGAGSSYGRGWAQGQGSRSVRCSPSSTARPAGDRGQARRSARSSAGLPPVRASGAALRRTSYATRMRSSSPARGSRSTSSSASSARQSRHNVDLPARDRPRGDHRHRPDTPRADDVGQRRTATLIDGMWRERRRSRFALRNQDGRTAAPRPLPIVHLESLGFDRRRARFSGAPIVPRGRHRPNGGPAALRLS